jgi:uncharacterized coiled-coil protein SlyX
MKIEDNSDETISQGLGIPNSWFEDKAGRVVEIWKEYDKVSEALEHLAQEIKDEEFETQIPVTDYEKKLILAGYVIGHASSVIQTQESMEKLIGRMRILGLEEDDNDEE